MDICSVAVAMVTMQETLFLVCLSKTVLRRNPELSDGKQREVVDYMQCPKALEAVKTCFLVLQLSIFRPLGIWNLLWTPNTIVNQLRTLKSLWHDDCNSVRCCTKIWYSGILAVLISSRMMTISPVM